MSQRDESVEIAVDEEVIDGTLLTPDPPPATAPGVLFLHGWGGSQEQYLSRGRAVASLGCVCLVCDLRGHVRSKWRREVVSREDNLRDCLAAYDRLIVACGVDPSAVGVVGSSYGGYLAAILTSRRAVRWLGLRAPALYEDDGWSLPKRWLHYDTDLVAFRQRAVPPEENIGLRASAAFRGDVLLVESEHDNVVPHPVIENYLSACVRARSLTYRVLEGADHGLSEEAWRSAYTTLLVSWLNEMTAGLRGPR
jgi:pimeloyl-ACP methyl ester carboxylesterase